MKTSSQRSFLTLAASAFVAVLTLSAQAAEAKGLKPYPLDTCVVSSEKLGGMGEPFVFAHEGQEIQLCCKSCKKDFDKAPAKFMAQINEANKKVKPYTQDTCLVSGEKLGAEPVVAVAKGQQVKFCCKDCLKEFRKNTDKYLAKLPKK